MTSTATATDAESPERAESPEGAETATDEVASLATDSETATDEAANSAKQEVESGEMAGRAGKLRCCLRFSALCQQSQMAFGPNVP